MNVTVINIKDLLKYLVVLVTSIFVIVSTTRFFVNKNSSTIVEERGEHWPSALQRHCLEQTIPIISYTENKNETGNIDNTKKSNLLTKLLNVELHLIDSIEYNETNVNIAEENINENSNNEEIKNEEEIKMAKTDVKTEVVLEGNIQPSYTDAINNIQIKNQSSYQVTDDLINAESSLSNIKDIIIFHTHTCESYTQTENYTYTPSGEFRTTNLKYSVAGVGDELDKQLTAYGYNVIHDTTYHDYPAYTGSYDRSLKTVQTILNNNPNTDVVIDLHRDAIGSNSEYGPSVMIGDEKVAQLMLVIGTDGGGLFHPNWRENFKFAVAIQKKANELYPGLFRPIILRDSRYNQHLANGACIIEVGATGNTMEECLGSMKYLAKILSEVIK